MYFYSLFPNWGIVTLEGSATDDMWIDSVRRRMNFTTLWKNPTTLLFVHCHKLYSQHLRSLYLSIQCSDLASIFRQPSKHFRAPAVPHVLVLFLHNQEHQSLTWSNRPIRHVVTRHFLPGVLIFAVCWCRYFKAEKWRANLIRNPSSNDDGNKVSTLSLISTN
jgi:hypothetical protein